jgi:hypothetical protein
MNFRSFALEHASSSPGLVTGSMIYIYGPIIVPSVVGCVEHPDLERYIKLFA